MAKIYCELKKEKKIAKEKKKCLCVEMLSFGKLLKLCIIWFFLHTYVNSERCKVIAKTLRKDVLLNNFVLFNNLHCVIFLNCKYALWNFGLI